MQSCRDKLVENNLRLVYYVFNKLHKSQLTIRYKEDLISEGMLGLIKAANSFDESKGNKFSTFATMCIRNQMLMFIRKANKFMSVEVSLYAPISNDSQGNELYLSDVLEDPSQNTEMHYVKTVYQEFMAKQKPIDVKILSATKYGYKQKEIAVNMKISQSYVSRRIIKLREKWLLFSA